jgi:hypothetical protein
LQHPGQHGLHNKNIFKKRQVDGGKTKQHRRQLSYLTLKLAELKQKCLVHDLETNGIKQDLVNVLQTCLKSMLKRQMREMFWEMKQRK